MYHQVLGLLCVVYLYLFLLSWPVSQSRPICTTGCIPFDDVLVSYHRLRSTIVPSRLQRSRLVYFSVNSCAEVMGTEPKFRNVINSIGTSISFVLNLLSYLLHIFPGISQGIVEEQTQSQDDSPKNPEAMFGMSLSPCKSWGRDREQLQINELLEHEI